MTHELIFAGFGGQGVMLMGQLVAYTAMGNGKNVSWFPSYGPEMRGGTANCAVVVSDGPVGSPVVSEPTALVAMNGPSLARFVQGLRPGGVLVYNSTLATARPERTDLTVVAAPATEIADALGEVKVANMVALGALIARTGVVGLEDVLRTLEKNLPAHRQHLLALNREALERGMALPATTPGSILA